ncbi:MAG: hypothetical protein J6Z27_05165 [Bacteroidales bacterium]|nr:hypothetical protein [Bacteroidales bacterium]
MGYDISKSAILSVKVPDREIKLIPLKEAKVVCAVAVLQSEKDAKSITVLSDYASKLGFELHTLLILKEKECLPACCLKEGYSLLSYGADYNNKEITNCSTVDRFCKIPADILFNLSYNLEYVVEAVMARSKARLKVSRNHSGYQGGDINVKVSILSKGTLTDKLIDNLEVLTKNL